MWHETRIILCSTSEQGDFYHWSRNNARIVPTSAGFEIDKQGLLICNEHGMADQEGVFAAGDVVHGPAAVVKAMDEGRRIAIEIRA